MAGSSSGTRTAPRKRSKMVVAVKIMPTVVDSRTRQLVHTLDVSTAGAKLGGIRSPFKPGDVLGVQRHNRRAKCKVIWVQEMNANEMQIGIEFLNADDRFWGLDLTDEKERAEASESLFTFIVRNRS